MKKSINHWAFPAEMPFTECLQIAKEAGFEAIELNVGNPDALINANSTESEVRAIGEQVRSYGLEMAGISSSLFWEHPLTSPDPAESEGSFEFIKKMIKIANWAGADTILVVPGAVNENVEYDVAYDLAQKALKKLIPVCEANGVVIGVENVWNGMLLSPMESARFIDEIGSPWIQWYFDVGNMVKDGWPEQWVKILGTRIRRIHIKDYNRDVPGWGGFCELLTGSIDYPKVMAALRKVGYDRYITAEVGARDRDGLIELGQKVAKIVAM